jgi:HSP20 family protein
MTRRKPGPQKPDGNPVDVGAGLLGSLTDLVESLSEVSAAKGQQARRTGVAPEGTSGPAGADPAPGSRFSRMLSGLAEIAEKLNGISEQGDTVSKKGEFTVPTKEGGVKGVYGFTVRTGLRGEDDQVRVEPFGNIRKDKATGEVAVQEISEPLVDVFEDDDATTLVAEMPGVGPDDITVDVREDILTIQAERGAKKYRKEMLLRHRTTREKVDVVCNNGVVTIRCQKAG